MARTCGRRHAPSMQEEQRQVVRLRGRAIVNSPEFRATLGGYRAFGDHGGVERLASAVSQLPRVLIVLPSFA